MHASTPSCSEYSLAVCKSCTSKILREINYGIQEEKKQVLRQHYPETVPEQLFEDCP